MISEPPPSLGQPSSPTGLSIVAGIAGVGAAIGAAAGGFVEQISARAQVDFPWAQTPLHAAMLALAGAVLALAGHEAGPPLVAGASSVIAVVVATTFASEGVDTSEILDEYPLRGLLFIGGGAAAAIAVVFGLLSLRGTANRGLGAVVALLSLGWLAAVAVIFRLDERRIGFNVRPFIGFAVIAAVCVIGALVGRFGALAAAAASALIAPRFLLAAEFAFEREEAAVGASIAAGAVVALGVVSAVLATRQAPPAFGSTSWPPQPPAFGLGRPQSTAEVPVVPPPPPLADGGFASPVPDAVHAPTEGVPHTVIDPSPWTSNPTSSQSVSTIAQWAPDPYGRFQMRYWDGARWTENVLSNGVAETDPV